MLCRMQTQKAWPAAGKRFSFAVKETKWSFLWNHYTEEKKKPDNNTGSSDDSNDSVIAGLISNQV